MNELGTPSPAENRREADDPTVVGGEEVVEGDGSRRGASGLAHPCSLHDVYTPEPTGTFSRSLADF